jgi:hypothetical protein
MKRMTKYLVLAVLAVVLMGTATIAWAAQGGPEGRRGPGDRGVGGEVTSIDGQTIYVENPHGSASIITTDNTEFVVNGEAGSLSDISVGMFAHAPGEKDDNGNVTATRVFASDEAPPHPRDGEGRPGRGVGGEVTSIDGQTINVENPRGSASIITTDDTEFVVNDEAGSLSDISVGMFVRAQGEKDDAGNVTATRVCASDEAPPHPQDGQGRPGRGDRPAPDNQ